MNSDKNFTVGVFWSTFQIAQQIRFKTPINRSPLRRLILIFKYLFITPAMYFQLNVTNMLIRCTLGLNWIGTSSFARVFWVTIGTSLDVNSTNTISVNTGFDADSCAVCGTSFR